MQMSLAKTAKSSKLSFIVFTQKRLKKKKDLSSLLSWQADLMIYSVPLSLPLLSQH